MRNLKKFQKKNTFSFFHNFFKKNSLLIFILKAYTSKTHFKKLKEI